MASQNEKPKNLDAVAPATLLLAPLTRSFSFPNSLRRTAVRSGTGLASPRIAHNREVIVLGSVAAHRTGRPVDDPVARVKGEGFRLQVSTGIVQTAEDDLAHS
ncbi:hypothetical protein [Bradyrhizobium ganzhouense]|uniref:hypothetical protein n=1 Tax=Bradyrhizobium ganzhouense TaxID=1179767 RepID=UPI003CEE2801